MALPPVTASLRSQLPDCSRRTMFSPKVARLGDHLAAYWHRLGEAEDEF